MKKKIIVFGIIIILIIVGLCGCNEQNGVEPGNNKIFIETGITSFKTTDYSGIEKDDFIQDDIVYTFCELYGIIHDGGYDCYLEYSVEKDGIEYENASHDFTNVASSDVFNHSWNFNPDPYWPNGTYIVKVKLTDKINNNTYTDYVFLNIINKPKAYAYADVLQGIMPLTVEFIGRGYDIDGKIVSYNWYFDDGETSNEQNSTHTFNKDGEYEVTLTVTDNDGITGEDTLIIIVFGKNFTLNPTDDVEFNSHTNNVYEYASILWVLLDNNQYTDWKDVYRVSALKFDISDILPYDRAVKSAKLRLFIYQAEGINGWLDWLEVKVHRSSDISWDEDDCCKTWATLPSYSPSDYVAISIKNSWYDWVEFDVTKYAQDALPYGQITLVLDRDKDYGKVGFYSKENEVYIPELVIEIE